MKLTVLVGGVGGAKFLLGVKKYLGLDPFGPNTSGSDQITAIVNTADDIRLHGLQICPDLDSCLYTLSGGADLARGWGRQDETWTVSTELAKYGSDAPWFSLGDKDIATHIMRTRMLDAGYPLSAVTEALCARWTPGVTLLPMTDDRVETHVVVANPEAETAADDQAPGLVALHFQEWWIRYGASLPAMSITPIGAEQAKPGPGVMAALAEADAILLAPSNPVVSIGTILAVPGIREGLLASSAPIVGVSPIIAGAPVRGHADACLAAIGVASSAEAVGRHYGARQSGGLLDGWLIADGDTAEIDGIAIKSVPLLMSDPDVSAKIVASALELINVVG